MAKETFAKQIVFSVSGIDGAAFDSANVFIQGTGFKSIITFSGDQVFLRKRPGRTKNHQVVVRPDGRIPEPERSADVVIELRDSTGGLVAAGRDTVYRPGVKPPEKEPCFDCVEK